jgi:hypothetical protein
MQGPDPRRAPTHGGPLLDDPDHDQRMRLLQRTAYGAVAGDAERRAARAELEAMRREFAEADDAVGGVADAPSTTGPIAVARKPLQTAAARSLKCAIAVGAAALVVGVAVGWQAAARTTVSEPTAADAALGGAASMALGPGEVVSVPVVASPAYEVFDRPPAATDTPPLGLPVDWYDPATLRLLASTPDGVAVYGAKASADPTTDACVVIAHAAGAVGGSCTTRGMFEHGRLDGSLYLEGVGLLSATWHADGSVQVSVPRG